MCVCVCANVREKRRIGRGQELCALPDAMATGKRRQNSGKQERRPAAVARDNDTAILVRSRVRGRVRGS